MALKNMYRLWSYVLSFFPQERLNIHTSWKVHSGRCQCLLPTPLGKLTLTIMLFHSSHPTRFPQTLQSAFLPTPRRHFPALPLTFQSWLRLSRRPPAHPPRPTESNNAATQPPKKPTAPTSSSPRFPSPSRPVTCLGGVTSGGAAAGKSRSFLPLRLRMRVAASPGPGPGSSRCVEAAGSPGSTAAVGSG